MTNNQQNSEPRGFRKTREGIVTSDKMDKTVTVLVEDRVKHSLYGKVMSRTHRRDSSTFCNKALASSANS
jgi:ribosomal protein S17